MTVEMLNTGSELLLGQTLNTHVQYLGRRLADCGLRIARQTTVPDGPEIGTALAEAIARAEIILVTGGLGPTSDDVTRDIAAALFRRELRYDPDIFERIRERFAKRGLTPPDRVKVQAMVPEGAEVLPNHHGTAPGLYLRDDPPDGRTRHLFLLPGPPRELNPMFETSVLPRLIALSDATIQIRTLRTIGIPESHLQERIEQPLRSRFPDLEIGYCARPGEVDLRLVGQSAHAVERAAAFAASELGDAVYAFGDDNLEDVVIRLATSTGARLATAESCTGGHLADRLTNVPGASAAFLGAAIVYSNHEKSRQLGVPQDLIANHGAVSEPVAAAMAEGCLARFGADHAIALTGVAGPGPGSPDKPAGLCCIAHASRRGSRAERRTFPPDRPAFKHAATQAALDILRRELLPPPVTPAP